MTPKDYTIDLPEYSGPLDLLLHLIEQDELDITAISLVHVTGQYLAQVERMKENRVAQLIDFLVISARLVLIKSRALLPQTPALPGDEELEEDPAAALVRQLRTYKRFKMAASWMKKREEQGLRTYLRVAPPPKIEGKLDLSGITVDTLIAALHLALSRSESMEESVSIIQPRRITIESQINRLRYHVSQRERLRFDELLSAQTSGVEVAVTLLAVLELIKRREVVASQKEMFGPIFIQKSSAETADAIKAPAASVP